MISTHSVGQPDSHPATHPSGLLRERLAAGPVLGDGGYVFELERRGWVQAGPYTPEVVVEHPEAVRALHLEFARAGAEVLQALTFYASASKLEVVGRGRQAAEINAAAVALARDAAAAVAHPVLVAGCLTQVPTFRTGDRTGTLRELTHQAETQAAAGADFIIGETFRDLEEALLAVDAIRRCGLPAVVTMNVGPRGSHDGCDAVTCALRLEEAGADAVGVNCSYDPDVLLATAVRMREAVRVPVVCQPVAFRTVDAREPFMESELFPLELEPRQMTRFDLARFARAAVEAGIRYVGGCCGVAPYHIRAMSEALGRRPAASEKTADLSRHALGAVRRRAAP